MNTEKLNLQPIFTECGTINKGPVSSKLHATMMQHDIESFFWRGSNEVL